MGNDQSVLVILILTRYFFVTNYMTNLVYKHKQIDADFV